MEIGLLVRSQTPDAGLLAEFGFASCQLLIGPGQSESRTIRAEIDRIRASRVQVSALGHYGNPLDLEAAAPRAVVANLRRMIDIAGAVGVSVVVSFAGRDPERSVEDNLPTFRRVWPPLIGRAGDRGVTVAIENCPMFHGHPFRGSNFAFSPSAWDLMFETIPSDFLALEYDPSHLIRLQIDYLQVVRDYGRKVAHVHATDAQLLWHNVRRDGIVDRQASRHCALESSCRLRNRTLMHSAADSHPTLLKNEATSAGSEQRTILSAYGAISRAVSARVIEPSSSSAAAVLAEASME